MGLEIRLDGLTISSATGGMLRLDVPAGTLLTASQIGLLGRLLVAAAEAGELRPVAAPVAARPAATAAPVVEAHLPGRPRKVPLTGAAAALKAAAEAVGPRKPGRPRSTAAKSSANVAPAAARSNREPRKATAAPRATRVVDLYDAWMADNPGPKTREQLIDVGVEKGWLKGDDAKRIFAVCMNRERKLFQMMREGNTDVYVRRAEVGQPTATPTRLVRRRGDREVLIGQRHEGAGEGSAD